jgi:isochorismate pyruvate lyase
MGNNKTIEQVQHCTSMMDVRRCVDALDDLLVPLLVQRSAYMTQAARIKQDYSQVRDEARIQTIVERVRKQALAEGGEPAVIEAIYRSMMEVCISFEQREFARLRQGESSGAGPCQGVSTPSSSGGSALRAATSMGAL